MLLSCVFYIKCCLNYAINVIVSLFLLKNLLKLFIIAYIIFCAFSKLILGFIKLCSRKVHMYIYFYMFELLN